MVTKEMAMSSTCSSRPLVPLSLGVPARREAILPAPPAGTGHDQALSCRCGHPATDHETVAMCEGLIHYADEDVPCGCDDLTAETAEECARCGHLGMLHGQVFQCRPKSQDVCGCIRPV